MNESYFLLITKKLMNFARKKVDENDLYKHQELGDVRRPTHPPWLFKIADWTNRYGNSTSTLGECC